MSKQYKGKTCVYCATPEASSTGDHVVARSFFLVDERAHLPQVPTCAQCNNTKSALETYLAALLPQGARHQEDVSDHWRESRRRIDRNQRLYRELQAGAAISSRVDGMGKPVTETTVPIDSLQLLDLSKYIAKGLLFHHWQVIVPKDLTIHSQFMNEAKESAFSDTLSNLQAEVTNASSGEIFQSTGLIQLGRGTVTYQGFFSPHDEPFSLWSVNFYRVRLGIPGAIETTSSVMMLIPSKTKTLA